MMEKNERNRLWAPWRYEFVAENDAEKTERRKRERIEVGPGADPECFICQANADGNDRERHVFFRSDFSIGILNLFPYNNGHLLIAPKRHAAKLQDLTPGELHDISERIVIWVERLQQELHPDGFNVGLNLGQAAGAGLPGHLHWHVVPRWFGDTNFMTAVGDTKVIPQSLDTLWSILTKDH